MIFKSRDDKRGIVLLDRRECLDQTPDLYEYGNSTKFYVSQKNDNYLVLESYRRRC
jgi:hypothetical protein